MNAKFCKKLRRLAASLPLDPETTYYAETHKMWKWQRGHCFPPITIHIQPNCLRGRYREFKRAYRNA